MSGVQISELARRAGVKVSTVRYYERAGLVPDPERSDTGYRLYNPSHEARLLFITRVRRLGLSLDQIADLLSIWDGTNCAETRQHAGAIIDANLDDLRVRIDELIAFEHELRAARRNLDEGPEQCAPDLGCCTPTVAITAPVSLGLGLQRRR